MATSLRPLAALLSISTVLAATACSSGASQVDSDQSMVDNPDDLFAQSSALPLTVSAPLATLFERLTSGKADPADADGGPVGTPTFSEPGQLRLSQGGVDKLFDVRVYVRGESSKKDCPFPKLKIDFLNKDQLKGTPFKGHGKFRINTHCGPGDASTRSTMGRVMNGIGPVREELVYRLVRALDIPTYLTRVTQISYKDTGANTTFDTFGMIIESGDDTAQRFAKMNPPLIETGAEYLDPAKVVGTNTPENAAFITVAEALSGNKDWFAGGTHNLDSFGVPGGATVFKIPEDFDLSAITLGDIAHYWKGVGSVTDAQAGLALPAVAAKLKTRRGQVEAALLLAEKDAVAAKAVPSTDGVTTTDPGFAEARKRVTELFALPELSSSVSDAGVGTTDAGHTNVADAAADAH